MLLIGNGRLITLDPALPYLENGAVLILDGIIEEVGDDAMLRSKYPQAEYLDAEGGLIMPGWINAHNHIYSAFARGLSIKGSHPQNFLEILNDLWWNIDRHLSLADTKASADAMFLECIENGVTTVFDHHASYGAIHGSLFAIAQSAHTFGLRTHLCYEVSDRSGQAAMESAVAENEAFFQHAEQDASDTVRGAMGMHASFTLSDRTLSYCVAHTPAGAGYHIHVSEGIQDVYDSLQRHGKRPVYRLHDFGILGKKTVCGHCTHVSEDEMDMLAETGSMVVHNPESNMGNAIGCPPVLRMFAKGICIGLGTDGYTNDMMESYKVANLLHKHHNANPTVAWQEIPAMLFENNRKIAARFFARPLGILQKGAHGDVITLDYIPQTPMNASNLYAHLLFGVNGRMVVNTVIGGDIKMRRRTLRYVDKEATLAHCREQAQHLWARIQADR